jgi:hypothetical protein
LANPYYTVLVGTTSAYTELHSGTWVSGYSYSRKSEVVEIALANGGTQVADGMLKPGTIELECEMQAADVYALNALVDTWVAAVEAQVGKHVVIRDEYHSGDPLVWGWKYDRVQSMEVSFRRNTRFKVATVRATLVRSSSPAEGLP